MIRISKYHGCGNDFVLVKQEDMVEYESGPEALALSVCDRKTGIGADGLIVAGHNPPEMTIFNSDGSQAPMCGNGIRCFVHFLRDERLQPDLEYEVRTWAGIMAVRVISEAPFYVEVCLGRPDAERLAESVDARRLAECVDARRWISGADMERLAGGADMERLAGDADVERLVGGVGVERFVAGADGGIPAGPAEAKKMGDMPTENGRPYFATRIVLNLPSFGEREGEGEEDKGDGPLNGIRIPVDCVFLGTMHTVLWLDEDLLSAIPGLSEVFSGGRRVYDLTPEAPLYRLAAAISNHPVFPEKTNVNLASVTGANQVDLITFERGAGLTEACGTGAASTAFLGKMTGRLAREVTIGLRHGALRIRTEEGGSVTMTGPSERIIKGIYTKGIHDGSDGNHSIYQ